MENPQSTVKTRQWEIDFDRAVELQRNNGNPYWPDFERLKLGIQDLLTEISLQAHKVAVKNIQVRGGKGNYWITLEQLDDIIQIL